jgi:hypothetical protein
MPVDQNAIQNLIRSFQNQCNEWNRIYARTVQVIFNNNLESVDWNRVTHIIVADNPGQKEKDNGVYLYNDQNDARTSGSIAKRLLDYLKIDQYVVLNKCPIYSKKTADLKNNDDRILRESQEFMAKLTFDLHHLLGCGVKVYIFGLGECFEQDEYVGDKEKGVMHHYFNKIRQLYQDRDAPISLKNNVHIFKHFSYWHVLRDFELIDLSEDNQQSRIRMRKPLTFSSLDGLPPEELINALEGLPYRTTLFNYREEDGV